jgi:hypothetical protein
MPVDTSPVTAHEAREHLVRLDISQQGFARLIRVSPQMFRRWLNPRSGYPIPHPCNCYCASYQPPRCDV